MESKDTPLALDDRRVEQLASELRRLEETREQQEPRRLYHAYCSVLTRAQAIGVRSADALWAASIAAERAGELEAGLELILQASATDPISPAYRRALDHLAARAEEALADEDREPDDPSTPRLHALLVRTGRASPRAHVALARHLAHTGDAAGAAALLEAVTQLAPHSREAWALRGELALTAGDTELARRCAAGFAAIAPPTGDCVVFPFPTAGVARA